MTQFARQMSILVLVLLLAAATRITNVSRWPVWTDEGWSIWATDTPQLDVVLDNLAHDRHPPLYFIALWGWRGIAGDGLLSLRYLSIAAGLLTIAAAYRIGADVFGKRTGLYVAVLLSVLPVAVYYSQEVRHYGWFVLCVLLSWMCLLRFQKYPTFGIWLGYIASLVLAFYTLYFALLPLAVQMIVSVVWRHRVGAYSLRAVGIKWIIRPKLWLFAAWAVSGLLYVPWLWVIATIQLPTLTSGIGNLPGTYPATLASIPALAELLLGTQWSLLLGLGALGIRELWRRKHAVRQTTQYPQWVVVVSGIGLLVMMFVLSLRFNLLSGRTLAFVVPLVLIVCAFGASVLEITNQSPAMAKGLSPFLKAPHILLGAWILVTLTSPMVIQPRIDSDTAASMVAADYAAGDLIVLETGWDDNAFAYQLRRVLPQAEMVRTISRADIYSHEKDLLPALMPRLEANRRVWVVQWLQAPQIMNALEAGTAGYRPVIRRELPVNADYQQRFGESVIQIVLYEKPLLDTNPKQFGRLFTLRDALVPTHARAGEQIPIDLWWSVTDQPPLDYSVGVFVLDSTGVVRADHNAAPADQPTTQWHVDEVYFDRHPLKLPVDLPAGRYSLVVKIYWYGDNEALPVDGQPYATVGEIEVQ